MIEFPDDDAGTIIDNINFCLELEPKSAQFTIYTPYYGTELRSWYKESGLIEDNNLSAMTSYKSIISTKKLTSEELQKFRDLASKIWEMAVKAKETDELKIKALELQALKSTYWYKISSKCFHFLMKGKKLLGYRYKRRFDDVNKQ